MKVKPDDEDLCKENSNEVNNLLDNKKKIIDLFKEQLDVKENVKNIKIYSGSIEIFDSEEYFNKNNKLVDIK